MVFRRVEPRRLRGKRLHCVDIQEGGTYTMYRIKLRRCTVDVEMENVGPIVMTRKIVAKLHLNTEIEVALRIKDPFFRSHRTGDDAAQRINDQRATATIWIAKEFIARQTGIQHFDHAFIHRAAGRNHECLAHLRESLGIDGDTIAQRIAAGRKMVRPAHDMNARPFGNQRKNGKRVGIFATYQSAHLTKLTSKGTECIAITSCMDETLADRRHDLLMLSDQRAIWTDVNLGVEHSARRVRQLFANSDDDVGIRRAG